jgi:hypothetical protein
MSLMCATSSSTTIRPVPRPSIRRPSLFYHTDRPSWTGRMLRQTCAKSVMRSSRAAISDKSIILYSSADERTTISNPYDHRASVLLIADVDQRPER